MEDMESYFLRLEGSTLEIKEMTESTQKSLPKFFKRLSECPTM
uniref:Uncharacterized protein n=1 Tax=Arundo donax TaxID=35708 RepID=A0A0A9G424_ARUDO